MQRMKSFAVYQSLRYLFILLSLLIVIFKSIDGDYLPLIFTTSEITLFSLIIIDISSHLNWWNSNTWFKWSKTHFIYGYKSFFSGLLLELNTKIDILILGYFVDDKYVGIYIFAAIFAEGFIQFIIVFQTIYNPTFAKLLSSSKIISLISLIKKLKDMLYLWLLRLECFQYFYFLRL